MENTQKKAVVLLNMGGPNSLFEVKTFLQNMFNDAYILPIKSKILRSFVANFIINSRLDEATNNYKQIGGKSPLVAHTFALCEVLNSLQDEYYFTYAMRYTPPFSDMVAKDLEQKGFKEVILFSMYPHFSYTTTASSMDDFENALKAGNLQIKVSKILRFFSDESYNLCIINRIKEALNGAESNGFHLVFSAHSLPQKNIDKGDPYQKEILENVEILKSLLKAQGLEFLSIKVAYQSKIGPIKWLSPNLVDTLCNYKNEKLLIYPIAFSIDNSESDFELSIAYKQKAQECGILDYRVAKCLNSGEDFANSILGILKNVQTN